MSSVTQTSSRNRTPLARRGLVAVGLSAIVNAVVLAIVRALEIAPGFRPFQWAPVLLLSIAGAAGAVVVYWLIERRSARPDRTFSIVAGVVLVASFIPDVRLLSVDENATTLAVLVLMFMHVTIAAVCLATLVDGGRLPGVVGEGDRA